MKGGWEGLGRTLVTALAAACLAITCYTRRTNGGSHHKYK